MMIRFHIDRDVEKSHGLRMSIGGKRGVSFSIQWRSWQPQFTKVGQALYDADRHDSRAYNHMYDPLMLSFGVFVWGTFLGAKPFSDTWLGRRCCSNGVTLFRWTPFKAPITG